MYAGSSIDLVNPALFNAKDGHVTWGYTDPLQVAYPVFTSEIHTRRRMIRSAPVLRAGFPGPYLEPSAQLISRRSFLHLIRAR